MQEKIVILGSQFICEKRICNIVQKTITIASEEVEDYLHLHKFFKDQRAIVVKDAVPVNPGFIFNGAEFVNPITMNKYPIDGDIVEEELDTSESTTSNNGNFAKYEMICNRMVAILKNIEYSFDEYKKSVAKSKDDDRVISRVQSITCNDESKSNIPFDKMVSVALLEKYMDEITEMTSHPSKYGIDFGTEDEILANAYNEFKLIKELLLTRDYDEEEILNRFEKAKHEFVVIATLRNPVSLTKF